MNNERLTPNIFLKDEKGDLRWLAMELLYRYGGLKGPEIGPLFGVEYSAMSQERKRLLVQIAEDQILNEMMERLKMLCQQ